MIINKREYWQEALAEAVSCLSQLHELLDLPAIEAPAVDFPLRVPRSFINRMERGNLKDPLYLQVAPQSAELVSSAAYTPDPLKEQQNSPHPGLLHKYHGRVLLVLTGGCAIHCRYCFRRSFPYDTHAIGQQQWASIQAYLESHPDITEVILSGGDPLILKDSSLASLFSRLSSIPHIKRIRIHSRIPVVLPERMTTNLWRTFSNCPLPIVLVVHSNHANELSEDVAIALKPAREQGVTLLNQSVLLSSINDSVEALEQLSERLFSVGILPYYLHVLDPVEGAAHFDVPDARAIELINALRLRLPGFLVPRLVREIPGEGSKTPLA